MFVFGFVVDLLAATKTDLLLGAVQALEMLTPGKQEKQSTEEVMAAESGHYTPPFGREFVFVVAM